ncbi:hypothetical protein [Aequorivita sinensis]|uniref:hypothetical protein n=1 Tax=Aequorivita sinensis TaxID=1382458 RepID=UPI00111FA3EF|nr:hypothetical protein [Aequorivita sinensis]
MKIKYAMAFLLVSLLTLNAFGQINAITEKGDSIIIYSNGTWKDKLPTVSAEPIDSNVNATVTVDEFSNKKSIKTENWLSFGVSKSKSKLSGYATYYNEGIYAVNLSISSDLGCMLQQDSTLKVKL